ncbi:MULTISPECIES: hypothetical protein [Flavobacterium]|jgi:hypothetical protein|uniref:Uncharacterized protein n=2 Tax=Flavobacterium TaxID=237 RepID=A0A562KEX2_9FLAO|nr:hypothetical protein [Flavobacterium cheniae]TDR26116.1 hypothetical protein C8D80_0910 [Flavobacterium cheniae]TWH93960.1 hypothetical protein IP97_01908 [Flavobacterium cheniae]
MKSILFGILFICATSTINSQNKNVKDETKTTTTTVVDSKGEKTYVKKENTREVQNIELKEQNPKNINMDLKDSAVMVKSTTTITNPDGSTRTVDIDRSSYYLLNGKKYNVALDSRGYRILSEDNKEEAFLRKTSTNSFIYRNKNKIAIGYFDVEGNLILETYDPKTDTVSYEKYNVSK